MADASAEIKVHINGKTGLVDRKKYVAAKTAQLREFGYSELTEKEVDDQINALMEKKKFGAGLTVIGMFMKDEVLVE